MALEFSGINLGNLKQSATTALGNAVQQAQQTATNYVGDMVSRVPIVGQVASLAGIKKTTGAANAADSSNVDNYKVKLISTTSMRNDLPSQIGKVVFEVTPTFSEDRGVEYSAVSPIHMPGSVQVYKRTNARTFSISAPFISRTREEATANMAKLQTLRGWTMPYFGAASSTGGYMRRSSTLERVQTASEMLGAPPDVLYLYAYSSPSSRDKGHVNINRVPVVISQLGIIYPEDVDYIPTFYANKEPMPTKMTVNLTLIETHSPYEFEQFSLFAYKNGTLKHF